MRSAVKMLKGSGITFGILGVILLSTKAACTSERPIIGIFCHEITPTHGCYIAASYVKAVEAAGARVAPIFLWQPPEYYRRMVRWVNGVLLPGGDAGYDVVGGYYQSSKLVYQLALDLISNGTHLPVMGVCLGHEFLARFTSGPDVLRSCPGMEYTMLPLEFTKVKSSLYGTAEPKVLHILATQNVTTNFHSFCVSPSALSPRWKMLSYNQDGAGNKFVSSMEDRQAPIVGIQFHPEKNAFEWQKNHPHYKDALLANRHFYDWLVTESVKNNNSFETDTEERDALIYNYNPSFSGKDGSVFTQKYIFPDAHVQHPTANLPSVQLLISNGTHLPVMGVCLGHEFLARFTSGPDVLRSCPGMEYTMLPLEFTKVKSSLYGTAEPKVLHILATQNVTTNFHSFCVSPSALSPRWKMLSYNQDGAGNKFVSSMEDRQAPIVGIQFHPEKNAFEWQKNHPHYKDALLANRHFYDWLVTESVKNNNSFETDTEERDALIYNYNPSFSGKDGSVFTQKYIFPDAHVQHPTANLPSVQLVNP